MGRASEQEDLRRRAEQQVRGVRCAAAPPGDALRLVHELEVRQVELELLNEELRKARREAEAGLRRYTGLFHCAPVGYLVVTERGDIQEANRVAAGLFGLERARLAGRRLGALVSREQEPAVLRFLAEVARANEPGAAPVCELDLRRPGEAPVVVRLTGGLLDPSSLLLSLEDITTRRRAEEALRDEGRRKDDFLAALSHELRNPLAPIRNGLVLLERAPPGSEQGRRALAVLSRQVCHLSRIVDDLLDVTRITRGKLRLRRERTALSDLVRRAVEDHRATFDDNEVELELALPDEPCWVEVDATRVSQVLGNLLVNAAKFTRRGDRVRVEVACAEGEARVVVRDTGVGIPPEVRARLFEPFAQAPQTIDRSRGGLGLGLAMVKGLVELHGGTVALASEGLGRGTEFTVSLPLAPAPPAAGASAAPARAKRRRVLVIDDNEDGASTLKEVLELGGHEVRMALDGPAGLAVAREFRPELVFCDIGLPGMDGYAVARALRCEEATRDAYLVALTGYALPDDLRRAREAGFDRHLAKPLMASTLEQVFDDGPAPSRQA